MPVAMVPGHCAYNSETLAPNDNGANNLPDIVINQCLSNAVVFLFKLGISFRMMLTQGLHESFA